MTPDKIQKDRAAGAWCIVTRFFTRVWCDITHGGGRIERDIRALITAGLHSSTIKKLKAFGYTCVKGKFVEDGAANH